MWSNTMNNQDENYISVHGRKASKATRREVNAQFLKAKKQQEQNKDMGRSKD